MKNHTRTYAFRSGPGILDQIDNDEVRAMISSPTRRRRQTSKYENGNTNDNKNCIKDDTNCGSKKKLVYTDKRLFAVPILFSFLYRTITGICNNLDNPKLASANAPIRFLTDKPSYDDGKNKRI